MNRSDDACPHKRWELGSDFHMVRYDAGEAPEYPWDNHDARTYGSGRDALRALISHGVSERGWQRIHIPAYFCQEVVASIVSTGIEVMACAHGPDDGEFEIGSIPVRAGDALLRVNYFGLSGLPMARDRTMPWPEVIDDHTHDLWSAWAWGSDADWCVSSLRKLLPVPDGGVVWSPKRHCLPNPVTPTQVRRTASSEKLAAMVLKGLYLEGQDVDKESFRSLAVPAEERISSGPVSGMSEWTKSLLPTFPTKTWRAHRRRNQSVLSQALGGVPWLRLLEPSSATETCPFSGILVFDTPERRDYVRARLIDSCVYPAILWSLETPAIDGILEPYIQLSRRLLSIPCDMRYNERDLVYVASLLQVFGNDWEVTPA